MKAIRFFVISLMLALSSGTFAQSVGINSDGSAPASSAMLDVQSTSKGFLAPRMTRGQRDAIGSLATGLMVYQTDNDPGYYHYDGSNWVKSSSFWTSNLESRIYYNSGYVGIGTTSPGTPLDFSNSLGQKINLYNGVTAGFGIQTNLIENIGWSSGQDWTWGYGTSGSLTRLVTIKGNGNVGVGTAEPSEKLDVNGVALSNYEGFSYYVSGLSVSASAWLDLVINTLDYNTFSGTPYNTVTGTFTAPRTGFYRFTLTGYSITPLITAGDRYAIGIKVNATLRSMAGGNYSDVNTPLSTYTAVVYLTAGQVVKPAMFTSIAATLGDSSAGHAFWFQGEFVGK